MINDKIIYVIFFVISLVVSVVAHIDETKAFASIEYRKNTVDIQSDSVNETGIAQFMLES